ncbi:SGNH hydrolase-type esterase domain-containing protein [Lasiosphaeria ovina]|uniref:SGNH hydrolase-type esterase domain-containing protein n=1 Tax=Lasiosphaeria ovina TaxID=92902 RepID=A0AAE0NEL1_9PEZI|nr:SGNH hydrolase-type esterase domain-containing protein [Lasiosphaeria ovina]
MAAPYPQVILFGDSLFQQAVRPDGFSFQAALETHCLRRLDVVNRGLSGYNTSNALQALPRIFPSPAPAGSKIEYLLVLFGANDASLPLPTNRQHVPLDRFKINLTRIITHPNIAAHKPKIVLITPPPLDEIHIASKDVADGHGQATREAKISAEYSEAVRQVAAANPDVILVDLWKALMETAVAKTPGFDASSGAVLGDPGSGVRGHLEHLLPDGLHMSSEAYRVFYDLVEPLVGAEWAGTPQEDRVAYVLPDHRVAPWLSEDEYWRRT